MTSFASSFNGTLPFSDISVQVALAAATGLTYTIPGTNAKEYRCEFSYAYNANVWIGYNTTAVVPVAGAVTTVANNKLELNPKAKFVRGGDVLSFISNAQVDNMGIALLELP
jgi:hypothetical protein